MKQNRALPSWCRILEGLIAEIAEERGEDPLTYKEHAKIRAEAEE